jgi:hypothetical protein
MTNKKPPPRLERWSQLRRRGDVYLLMGRFSCNGQEPIVISVHASLEDANLHNLAYLAARERERDWDYYIAKKEGPP